MMKRMPLTIRTIDSAMTNDQKFFMLKYPQNLAGVRTLHYGYGPICHVLI